jgi:hypothetical protein
MSFVFDECSSCATQAQLLVEYSCECICHSDVCLQYEQSGRLFSLYVRGADQLKMKEHYRAALAVDDRNADLLREFANILGQNTASK